MNRTLKENAKEIGVSISYLSEILRGKKGCSYVVMQRILKYYPNLKASNFKLLNPRYILRGEDNE